ncbi:DNA polymerase III subunit chi [Oleispirillum naphthae]|uniref:DNA polymerase III subunit chi n=1 Tax=Oleispirillum naphthae TaxID=2838853 RepID=UPI0030823EB0
MARIDFYHLQKWPLERALPELLERALARGMTALVTAASADRVKDLDALLWTYREDSWLPHGAAGADDPASQPVWITDAAENPNGADLLVITEGADLLDPAGFARCLDLFDGGLPEDVESARRRWARYREAGHGLAYWQQDGEGRWTEKANSVRT